MARVSHHSRLFSQSKKILSRFGLDCISEHFVADIVASTIAHI